MISTSLTIAHYFLQVEGVSKRSESGAEPPVDFLNIFHASTQSIYDAREARAYLKRRLCGDEHSSPRNRSRRRDHAS